MIEPSTAMAKLSIGKARLTKSSAALVGVKGHGRALIRYEDECCLGCIRFAGSISSIAYRVTASDYT